MRGKWAAGIPPRHFAWIIRDRLAVSERPGGFAPNHRRVRRQEELIWLHGHGFARIVSLLPSPHNLAAYDEEGIAWSNFPITGGLDPRRALHECFLELDRALGAGERVLVHQEELSERVLGTVAAYLCWSGRLSSGHQAVTTVELLVGRQMGAVGRQLVVEVAAIPRRSTAPEPPGQSASGAG